MSLSEYIRRASSRTQFPVSIDMLLPEIQHACGGIEIYPFRDPNMDPAVLRGSCIVEEIPDESRPGGKYLVATINYAVADEAQMRLVCCKELLHLLDPEICRPTTPSDVAKLAEDIALPSRLVDPVNSNHEASDRLMELLAAAVLLPLATRDRLVMPLKEGKVTLAEICDVAEIPQECVVMIMNERWPQTLAAIIKVIEALEASTTSVS